MNKTLLGQQPTKEEIKNDTLEDQDWERYNILLNILCDAYINNDIKKLENMCLMAFKIAKNFKGTILPSIPKRGRDRMIGSIVMKALSEKPLSNSPSPPAPLKKLIVELVKIATNDGYTLTREFDNSAFEFIAKHMRDMGVNITARTVEKYWQEHNNKK